MKYSLLIIFVSLVFANEEIEVLLPTQNSLKAVKIVSKNLSKFSNEYIESLKKVLNFDINHNGFMQISEMGTNIELSFVDKKVSVMIANKKFSPMALVGDLSIDRKQMHKIADGILEALCQKKGVSTLHLLYSKKVPTKENKWISELWLCDYDGENNRQITHENSFAVHPVFIPSKRDLFIYVSYKNGQPRIYLSNLKNSFSEALLSIRGNQLLPSISPRGNCLAFVCDAAGRADLFIQKWEDPHHFIGRPQQLFSAPRATQASSSFSPDGSKIAFVSDKDGAPRIYVVETKNGANCKLITRQNRENVTPSWSLDGTKLAYSAKTDGVRQIWIYDFDKDEEWQLTKGTQNKENPLWAPDGLHIVYNTEEKDVADLYIVNLNQPNAVKITSGIGKKRFPAWEPY